MHYKGLLIVVLSYGEMVGFELLLVLVFGMVLIEVRVDRLGQNDLGGVIVMAVDQMLVCCVVLRCPSTCGRWSTENKRPRDL